MNQRKRLYYHSDGEFVWAVVAHSLAHAKKLLWADRKYSIADICDGEYINLNVKWWKEHDVSDLPIGMLDGFEGLRRGILNKLFDHICPECGSTRTLEYYSELNTVCCYECEDELAQDIIDEREEDDEFCGEMP